MRHKCNIFLIHEIMLGLLLNVFINKRVVKVYEQSAHKQTTTSRRHLLVKASHKYRIVHEQLFFEADTLFFKYLIIQAPSVGVM